MIKRFTDWPSRLNLYLKEVQERIPEKGLKYGEFDCCIFIADAVVVMTGVDLFKKYRRRYKTKIGASRILKRMGGLRKALASVLGQECHKAMVCQGDIVYLDGACGICFGHYCLFLHDSGFSKIPTAKIDCGFHV